MEDRLIERALLSHNNRASSVFTAQFPVLEHLKAGSDVDSAFAVIGRILTFKSRYLRIDVEVPRG
jgi:hypothetical protein